MHLLKPLAVGAMLVGLTMNMAMAESWCGSNANEPILDTAETSADYTKRAEALNTAAKSTACGYAAQGPSVVSNALTASANTCTTVATAITAQATYTTALATWNTNVANAKHEKKYKKRNPAPKQPTAVSDNDKTTCKTAYSTLYKPGWPNNWTANDTLTVAEKACKISTDLTTLCGCSNKFGEPGVTLTLAHMKEVTAEKDRAVGSGCIDNSSQDCTARVEYRAANACCKPLNNGKECQ